MDKNGFIKAIKTAVRDGSISGVVEDLLNPPIRNPNHKLVNLSKWYISLDQDSKDRIKQIVEMSVDDAIFGIMCVLDGVRSIEDYGQKGDLKLEYQKGEKIVLLNDPNEESLHDLYNEK
jgi:hypothetical protein